MLMSESDFKKLCFRLKRVLPTSHPVRIRRTTLPDGKLGDCDLYEKGSKKYFLIRIQKGLEYNLCQMILMHEYAHALAWTEGNPEFLDHGPVWGVCYARVWQEIIEP